jgi:hypothetical protein
MANSKSSKKKQPANKGKARATKTNLNQKRGADGEVDEEVSVSVTCRRKKAKLSFEEVNEGEDSDVEEVNEVEILEPNSDSDEVRRIFIFTKSSSYLIRRRTRAASTSGIAPT